MTDESQLSSLANDLLDSLVMQHKAGIDGGGGSKSLPGHPDRQSLAAYEELAKGGFIKAKSGGDPRIGASLGRWELTPKGMQLVSCASDPS